MIGKIILGLGITGILLGGAITAVAFLLPTMTRNINMREAMPGVIAGIVVLIISFVPAIVGVILMMMRKKS